MSSGSYEEVSRVTRRALHREWRWRRCIDREGTWRGVIQPVTVAMTSSRILPLATHNFLPNTRQHFLLSPPTIHRSIQCFLRLPSSMNVMNATAFCPSQWWHQHHKRLFHPTTNAWSIHCDQVSSYASRSSSLLLAMCISTYATLRNAAVRSSASFLCLGVCLCPSQSPPRKQTHPPH